jgi:hypothetical protein
MGIGRLMKTVVWWYGKMLYILVVLHMKYHLQMRLPNEHDLPGFCISASCGLIDLSVPAGECCDRSRGLED